MKQKKIKSGAKEFLDVNADELSIAVVAKRTIEDIEGLLAAIVQSSEDAIISKTLEGIVTSWNPAAEKLFGYKSSEMIGQPITKIIPKERLNEEPDIIRKIQAGEIIAHFETQRVSKEGKLIDISLTISPVKDIKGNIIGASKIARDIGEQIEARKKIENSEEQLRKTTQHFAIATSAAEVGIWSLDIATQTLEWSDLHKKMWGYTELETNLTYDEWHKLIVAEDKDAAFAAVASALKTKSLYDVSYRIKRADDGDIRWIKSSGQYFYNDAGDPLTLTGVSIDITEQKKAERALKESEERLRLATQTSGVGIWEWNVITNKVRWDAQMFHIYGVAPTADGVIEYQTWSNAVVPEDLAEQERILLDMVKNTGSSKRSFKIFRVNDGMLCDIEAIETARTNAEGEAEWVVGTNMDVTEQKRAVEKIKDSEKRYNLMLMQSPFAFLILKGKDMVVHLANESMKEVLGKGSDIEGKPLLEVLPEIKGQAFPDLLDNVYNTGIAFTANEMLAQLVRNGKLEDVYFNYVYQPYYEADNTISGVTVIAYDVTASVLANKKIKESEERFRFLTQTLPQLIWVTDAQGNAEFASSRWKEYSGLEPDSEKEWRAIVHPDDYDNINAAWINSLTTGNRYTFDVRLKNKDDEYRWHTVKGEPVLDKENKIVKWVGAFTDIHDHKIKEEKKDEFISIASHEMKTPLTTAKAYLQMLELSLDESNEDANLYAKKACQSVNRLNELISELLDVSKIRLGKLNYTVSTFDFNDMVESTVENIQLTSPTHTIIKTGKVYDEVTGDKDRLQQVVINLLTNAIKYSPGAEKVFITIEQEKGMIKVSVKDTGIGIAQQSLNKIFEKYHRVEEHAIHFQGLGIGLFISYEIIQRHHGKLWAESEVGKGSTFYFSIPASNALTQ